LKTEGEVALYKPNDRPILSKVSGDFEAFSKWIDINKKPLWEELSYSNIYSIWQGNPNFIVFMNNPESEPTKKIISIFTNIAKEYGRGSQLNFVVVNGDVFKDFVTSLGLVREDLPTFAIVHPSYHEEYTFPKTQSFTLTNVKRWLDLFLNRKLTPNERDLYSDSDSIIKVASETWTDTVLDGTKDVLVEFYGNNCKFCQLMAPHYKQLSLIFSSTENIIITIFDTGKSTPPASLNVTGIPALYFFPANNKLAPVLFQEQDRSIQNLFSFVMKHQTTLTPEIATDLTTRVNQYFTSLKAAEAEAEIESIPDEVPIPED